MKSFSFRPNRIISSIVKETQILKFYKLNRLLNYGLLLAIEEINKNNNIRKYAKKGKTDQAKKFLINSDIRSGISELIREETHKVFYLNNVLERLKLLIQRNIKVEKTIKILELCVKKSETFQNNKETTRYLKALVKLLKKTRSYDRIADFINIQIIETKHGIMIEKKER